MSSLCEDDSDDADIFVVRRLKPVGKLTKEKALEIKKKVLDRESINSCLNDENNINSSLLNSKKGHSFETSSEISNQEGKGVFDDDDDISILEEKINKSVEDGSNAETPIKSTKTPEKSPPKLITNYFTPTKRLSVELSENSNNEETSLSDAEKRRKRLKNDSINGEIRNSSKSQSRTRRTTQSRSKSDISSNLDNSSDSEVNYKNIHPHTTTYYYSKSLKGIIHHEILNQALLEQKSAKEGKNFGRLFLESEFQDVERFFKLPENAFELFARMICRKKGWHRISTITYENIMGNIEDLFRLLNKNHFVDFDIEKENLEAQLNLLKKQEIEMLCKTFNIRTIGTKSKKNHLINAIVKSRKSQRAVTEMWNKDCSSKREDLLTNEIIKTLGPCMKLNETFLSLLNRILLLFCLPYYIPEEDKWSTQIHTMIEINMNIVSYPSYEIKPTVIFDNRDDLICYERALNLMYRCEGALVSKNNKEFTAVGQEARVELKKLLEDEGFKGRVKTLPPFLRRYNAGSIYAKILTTYCERLKKIKDPTEVVEIMETLTGQDTFAVSKKGSWYNLLVQAYFDLGKSCEAGSALLKVLKEETVNEVAKLQLQQRGGLLLKKKKNALGKGDMRDELGDICTVDMMEPSKVEIEARAMDSKKSGYKTVYMYKDKSGALTFLSVEETVINHYKEKGFPQGVHAEGFIIQTLYFLVFFDIIYKLSPVGVFQNPYQSEPMDFASMSFYLNRKREIDARLEEMRSWTMEKFQDVITKVYTENLGVRCVISWKEGYTPQLFCEILRCLGLEQFTRICERLVHNFRVYRSGFPDLTVWNPLTRKCKFVEVKSPNDKLSPNQRLWLDFLRKLNVDCEVCSVKNIASRRMVIC